MIVDSQRRRDYIEKAITDVLRMTGDAHTASELATRVNCSVVTIYRSLDRLVAQGYTFSRGTKRASKTGPLSTTYKINT